MSIAMSWWQFRNSGSAITNPGVILGVMPQGQLLNAMEIVFQENDTATRGRRALHGYCRYRVRQTLAERDFQFFNGQWYNWASKPEGTPDDPHPDVQSWNPPYMRMLDTPGWSAYLGIGPNSRTLNIDGMESNVTATEVWVQQLFKTWVQGEDCFSGNWDDVSIKVVWHNSLHLIRDNLSSPWRAGTNCRIQHGPMVFGTTALL